MSEEIKDIMDALENNELKNDGFWGRACSRLSQQLQACKEENEKLMEQLNTKYLEWEETFMENQNLTQQNKQLETEKLRMQTALDKIRDIELESLDVDWDEYKAECGTTDFSAIVTNCEIGLGETEE